MALSQVTTKSPVASRVGLDAHGISATGEVHWHSGLAELLELAIRRGEGTLTRHGAFVAETLPRTGRSPKDKFIVREESSEQHIWWGSVNRPIERPVFDATRERMRDHLAGRDALFVQDVWCGADRTQRMAVRVVTENAWHAAFVNNMFVQATDEELAVMEPEFIVLHAPSLLARGAEDGLNSEAFVLIDYGQRTAVIGGTRYAGEIKKCVFSIMSYFLPLRGVLPMHCSANTNGEVTAVFFGLSGTGKTTLSADPDRALVGDDEHGWSNDGVFNFEGGCYAKLINLSEEEEPEIFATTRRFGTILENVVLDDDRVPDFFDGSKTENTRCSYPIEYIDNRVESGTAGQPQHVVFLTCDAFGVLPPVSRLTPAQAAYHFISGYTAKVAGTEVGIVEPRATFSSCFGSPFLPSHPSVYAELLAERIEQHGASCWLINSGWTGGAHGTGHRMSIKHTRRILNAALNGELDQAEYRLDERFGFEVPLTCEHVPDAILEPRRTWTDRAAYDAQADELAQMFIDNFAQFADGCSAEVNAAAPRPLT